MIKMVLCIRKKSNVTMEDFHSYWKNEHGLLVKNYSKALGIKRYVQSHGCHQAFASALAEQRSMPAGYDGLAELWWDSLESLQAALQTPEGYDANAALAEDEANFIDFENSTIFFTEEHEMVSFV